MTILRMHEMLKGAIVLFYFNFYTNIIDSLRNAKSFLANGCYRRLGFPAVGFWLKLKILYYISSCLSFHALDGISFHALDM